MGGGATEQMGAIFSLGPPPLWIKCQAATVFTKEEIDHFMVVVVVVVVVFVVVAADVVVVFVAVVLVLFV